MRNPSPYRSLPAARRVALVQAIMSASKEGRALYVQRLTARGGFRAVTVSGWPVDRIAREVVRMNAETPQDEYELMHLLYVELEPQYQATFLDAVGVKHEGGKLDESLEPPYCDAEAVRRGAAAVVAAHGEDGVRYLKTLARYAAEGWPGIDEAIAAAGEGSATG